MKWDVVGTRVECSALRFLPQLGRSLVQEGIANPRRREKGLEDDLRQFSQNFMGKNEVVFFPFG